MLTVGTKTDDEGSTVTVAASVVFEKPVLVGSNTKLPYLNSTTFPHFFFPSISVKTGRGSNVAQRQLPTTGRFVHH